MIEAFDLHGRDFTPLLQKVKAAGAQAFMSDARLDDYITMQRQYRQNGLHHAYVTTGADYIVAAAWWNKDIPNANARAFDEKWARAYPQMNPEWYAALPYETGPGLFIALNQTGSVDKKPEGTTVLLVEQNVRQALEIARRGYVIKTGRVVTTGTRDELLASDEIRKAYLGL